MMNRQKETLVWTFDTPDPIAATIAVVAGDVRMTATDRATTTVEVRPSDASSDDDVRVAEATGVEFDDGQLRVRTPRSRSWLSRTSGSIDVTVELPADSQVQATLGLASLRGDGRLGDCRIKAGMGTIELDETGRLQIKCGAGDVTVGRASGTTDIVAASGDLRLRELGATAVIKNANGDTWVGTADGDLRMRAANGDLRVELALDGVTAKSANGDVRLGEVVRGVVVAETHFGDVEVGVRAGTSAWLDVSTAAGTVRTDLDAAGTPADSADTVEIRARTSLGQISIRRVQEATDAR